MRDGLTRNQLEAVRQDARGFVWVAGKRGLDRFDGLEVVAFHSDSTMQSDRIRQIGEDENERVVFLADDYLYYYDGSKFTGKNIPTTSDYRFLSTHRQRPVIVKKNENGTLLLDGIVPTDTLLQLASTESIRHEQQIRFSGSGGMYMVSHGTSDTLMYVDLKGGFRKKPLKTGTDIKVMFQLVTSDTNRVIINDSVFLLVDTTLVYESMLTFKPDYLDGSFYNMPTQPIYKTGFEVRRLGGSFPVLHVAEDYNRTIHQRKDRLYIASEEGLKILKPQSPILLFPTDRGMASDAWSIMEGGAAAGAEGGSKAKYFSPYLGGEIVKMQDGQYRTLDINAKTNERFYPGGCRSTDGTLLVPTNSRILRLDPASGKIRPLDRGLHKETNDLHETNSRIYAATNGLAVYENDRFLETYGDEDGLDVSRLAYLESINEDRDGHLWLGSHKGLAVRLPDGSFRNHYAGEDVPAGIVHGATDYRGNLWFASHDGLAHYDYTSPLPRWVTPDFHEDVKFVHPIDSNCLLVGGVSKLYLLDLPKFYAGEIDIYPFDEDDGFPVVEPLQASVMKDSEGIIWIGTTDGVVWLDPAKIKTYKTPTEPHFHSFSWLDESGEDEQTIVIPFNENGEQYFSVKSTDQNIDIRFFTINHDKPHAMRFRHRLVGYRDSWTPPSATRTVNYGELPPGDYRFELRACLYGKCTDAKTLRLRVSPARFWEYPVVRFGFGGLILFVLGMLSYTLYTRYREREQAKLQAQAFELERADARRKLTVHKIGPHFANNALTAISDLIIREENEAARRYTSHFAELFKPVLEDSLGLLWTLAEELDFIDSYLKLEELRFGEKLRYSVVIDPLLEEATDGIMVPSLLIQSFVNNAVKHGVEPVRRGVVAIELRKQDENYLRVTITDNGPGFKDPEGMTKGTGITAARVMLDYLNEYTDTDSTIAFSTPPDGGTAVTITLYLHHQLID